MYSRGQDDSGRRGQAETLGVVLMLGIAVVTTGMVVAFGSTALDDTQQSSELQNAAHVMTQFDSRASQVALGSASVQSVSFDRLPGEYSVRSGAGRMTIRHEDWDGAGGVETIYDEPLGAVVYENGDERLVYQGGGVWRDGPVGSATMVSPPEFHYRGATLTLPVIRVAGDESVAGGTTAIVTEDAATEQVFPDASTHYEGDSSNPVYHNPAKSGKLEVVVESEYYQGWASYFRERTTGDVTVDDANQKVTLELVSTGDTGHFEMPGEGSGVDIRGVADHSMSEFSIALRPGDSDSANFANLQWSMFVEDGGTQFEIHVRQSGGSGCTTEASASVYYSEDGGSSYHGWYDDDAFTAECGDYNGDGDDEVRMVADFVDADDDDPELTYRTLSGSDLVHFNPSGSATTPDPVTLDGHGADWEPSDYDLGDDEETIDRLLNHYFSEMGNFELTVDDKSGDTVSEDASSGSIEYTGTGQYVTFLHVTENDVRVTLD